MVRDVGSAAVYLIKLRAYRKAHGPPMLKAQTLAPKAQTLP